MKSKIYDITPVISPRIGVWPGDTKFKQEVSLEIEKGHSVRLSSMLMTTHLGAHTDAPNHYEAGAEAIEKRDLDFYLGPCLVIRASALRGERVSKRHLEKPYDTAATWPAARILVATGSFPNPDKWNSDFNSFDPDLIREWAKAGVKMIGLDTPSIDPESSKDLPSHKMVAKHDPAILEGVVLNGVPSGVYTLIALPLKIEGADASPVRAILVSDDGRAFA